MFSLKELDSIEWHHYSQKCLINNMLQTWQYGDAKKNSSSWNVVRFLISDDNSIPIGLVQIMLRSFSVIGSIARINRGPLLLGNINENQVERTLIEIIYTLIEESKKRNWRMVFLAPEIHNSLSVNKSLTSLGLHRLRREKYGSGLIDLKMSENNLLMSFKKKWRYYLRKSLSTNLNIKISKNSSDINLLLKKYKDLQNNNSFTGISESLILGMSNQENQLWSFNLFIAKDASNDDECEGMLVFIKHGNTATYLIGLTSSKGKESNANYALLWNAILYAKELGCDWFDIGGMDETTPKGIKHFKKGLNANLYSLTGEWGYFMFPFTLIRFIFTK